MKIKHAKKKFDDFIEKEASKLIASGLKAKIKSSIKNAIYTHVDNLSADMELSAKHKKAIKEEISRAIERGVKHELKQLKKQRITVDWTF